VSSFLTAHQHNIGYYFKKLFPHSGIYHNLTFNQQGLKISGHKQIRTQFKLYVAHLQTVGWTVGVYCIV